VFERPFRDILTNGIRLRVLVEGQGPLVILVHGFPQGWYLWRRQIAPLVAAGYCVAVPDMRGYGGSDRPAAVEDYNIVELCRDVDGIASALGAETYTVVGHDWGALVAWHTALLYRARVRGVVGMGVPYVRLRRGALTDQANFGDRFWYIAYFQEPDRAETELERDVRRSLRMMFAALGGSAGGVWLGQLQHPRSAGLLDCLVDPPRLPEWLTEDDLDYYTAQFRESGFRGPINWYRNIDRNLDLTPQLETAPIEQPALFIAGANDPVLGYLPGFVDSMDALVPNLRAKILVPGAGHWVQVEQPDVVNRALLEFLRTG
jgi:pimeloyl-ACP methyl ester carboxylesterase